jgi:hypothetical protein
MVDVGQFKMLKDRHRHQASDAGARLPSASRSAYGVPDILRPATSRAEFAAILPDAGAVGLIDAGERVCTSIEALALAGAAGRSVTISVVASLSPRLEQRARTVMRWQTRPSEI